MGTPYPRINTLCNPLFTKKYFQPTSQIPYNQLAQPLGQFSYTQVQQLVQGALRITPRASVPSSQLASPSTPSTHIQSVV